MKVEDVEMTRSVRRELARRHLDVSESQVSVMHGVIHLYGRVHALRGHEDEFAGEILALHKILKQRPGIREVIMEWDTGTEGIAKRIK